MDENTKLAHYEVVERIGAGGMGEVYRARDTKLDRDVALKLLPATFAQDAERLARFEREARVLASLNHAGIAAIYGIEHDGDQHFLVLELVEGEDLSQRLSRGSIPVEDAVPIARQIAEALEFAHEQGIIHRDLKPANVKVTPDGTVKVLDFGLAKAFDPGTEASDPGISHSPTLIASGTMQGVILGTAAYMSPEQARGRKVDRRADIFAFGCVLYEMLTGFQVFAGETVSDTLAAVLRSEPDWEQLPDGTPASLRALMTRCLDKDPKRRLRDIGEARIILEGDVYAKPEADAPRAKPGRKVPLWATLLFAGAAAATAWFAKPSQQRVEKPGVITRHALSIDFADTGNRAAPVISPDGRRVAFLERGQLWVRDLDRLEARPVEGATGADALFWSPASDQVGYFAGGRVWKVDVDTGARVTVCEYSGAPVGGVGATWGESGRILFSLGFTGLFEVSARGGEPTVFLATDPALESDLHDPHLLPGERGILFVSHLIRDTPCRIELFADGERRTLYEDPGEVIWYPWYDPAGYIVYRHATGTTGLWALPFSLERLEVTGEPFLVVQDGGQHSLSREGTLLYVSGVEQAQNQLAWYDRSGRLVEAVGGMFEALETPALSHDGSRVAAVGFTQGNADIWVYDLTRGTRSRLTFGDGREDLPEWTTGDDQLVYRDPAEGRLLIKPADGSGVERRLIGGHYPELSEDGEWVVFVRSGAETDEDIWCASLADTSDQKPVVVAPGRQLYPRVSPNGRFLAYRSDEAGSQVYLTRFPSGEGKWQVSTRGGTWPRWSPEGDRLFFFESDVLAEVPVEYEPSLAIGSPRKLFATDSLHVKNWGRTGYDVAPHSERFLLIRNVLPEGVTSTVTLVRNWSIEFEDDRDR